jgi:hypothetical protein
MFVGITRSILLVFGIVSIDAGRYVSVPAVFLLESMLFFNSDVYGFIYTLDYWIIATVFVGWARSFFLCGELIGS